MNVCKVASRIRLPPLSLTPTILPAGMHPACHGDSMGVKEAAVYRPYSYAALSVQLCCTLGAR